MTFAAKCFPDVSGDDRDGTAPSAAVPVDYLELCRQQFARTYFDDNGAFVKPKESK